MCISELNHYVSFDFANLNGNFTADFKSNFSMLDFVVQRQLYSFILFLQTHKNCSFGTQSNLSVYSKDGYLLFYINITGKRGKGDIKDYLQRVNLETHFLCNSTDEATESIPSVFIGRKDQFLRKVGYDEDLSPLFYNELLEILGLPLSTDVMEVSAADIEKLLQNCIDIYIV